MRLKSPPRGVMAKLRDDRFANAQTNYLLQRIESFDGIAILASNGRDRRSRKDFRNSLDWLAGEAHRRRGGNALVHSRLETFRSVPQWPASLRASIHRNCATGHPPSHPRAAVALRAR